MTNANESTRTIPPDLPQDPDETYGMQEPLDAPRPNHGAMKSTMTHRTPSVFRVKPGEASLAVNGAPPVADPAFVLRKKIGEGGHGLVWQAVQTSLGRTIAIKTMKLTPGGGSRPSQTNSRQMELIFKQEAITAAHLEHPNIIPVHDLGTDENGKPMLAMKLVKGQRWKDVLKEDFENAPVADFLATHLPVLVSVTQAVAFAHSHGIIHRDLKPSQVMIGRFGEVVLMDWGLAMVHQPDGKPSTDLELPKYPDSPLYSPPNPAGTPYYMAPEQTETDAKNLGPWTDVYLLGAILYQLLTGHPPHNAEDGSEAFEMARQGIISPLPLELSHRQMPASLMNLALQAMNHDKAMRPQNAEEFCTTLRSHMSGSDKRRESMQLVTTVAESFTGAIHDYDLLADALNKLEQSLILWPDNKWAAQLRQEALLFYAQTAMANGDLKLARVQAERLSADPNRETILTEIADKEAEVRAQDERLAAALRQAKGDRHRAEHLVRFLLGDLYSALKPLGRLDVLQRITEESLNYFDTLGEADTSNPALHNRCVAYMNIGDVLCDQGRKKDAEDSYRKAKDIAYTLTQRDEDRHDWVLDLADIHDRLGQVLYYEGRNDEALAAHMESLSIRTQVRSISTDTMRVRMGVANAKHRIGIIQWRQQDLQNALQSQTESLAEFNALSGVRPEDVTIQAAIGWNLSTLGNVYRDLGQIDMAMRVTREGLDAREALVRREPKNLARKEEFLWTKGNLALMLLLQGDLEAALDLFERIVPMQREVTMQDPENVVRLNALTFPLSLTCEILFVLGRIEEAEHAINECLQVNSRLERLDPMSVHVTASGARQRVQLGQIRAAQGRWREASDLSEQALAGARKAAAIAPKNAMFTKSLVNAQLLRGHMARVLGDTKKVNEMISNAHEALPRVHLKADETDHMELSAQLALLQGAMADAEELMQRLEERRYLSPYMRTLKKVQNGLKPAR